MLKTVFKLIVLFLCALGWMFLISHITFHPNIIGEIKLWAGLLGTALSLSVWARYILKSKAATEAYESLFKVFFFYACTYVVYRLLFYGLLDLLLKIPVSSFVASGLTLLFLVWTSLHTQIIPILLAHGHIQRATRYLAAMQKRLPESIELAAQKIVLLKQHRDEQAILDEMARITALYKRPQSIMSRGTLTVDAIAPIYRERLALRLARGEGEEALSDARIILALNETPDQALIERGMAFLLVNDLDAAAADLEQALKIATLPRYKVIAKLWLGLIEYMSDNDEQAEAYWDWALRFISDLGLDERHTYSAKLYANKGLLAFHRGDAGKAWQAYDMALRSDRHCIEARVGMAVVHAANEHWEKALKLWRGLQAEYPYFADPEQVIRRHFRWSPLMADGIHRISARVEAPPARLVEQHDEQPLPRAMMSRSH